MRTAAKRRAGARSAGDGGPRSPLPRTEHLPVGEDPQGSDRRHDLLTDATGAERQWVSRRRGVFARRPPACRHPCRRERGPGCGELTLASGSQGGGVASRVHDVDALQGRGEPCPGSKEGHSSTASRTRLERAISHRVSRRATRCGVAAVSGARGTLIGAGSGGQSVRPDEPHDGRHGSARRSRKKLHALRWAVSLRPRRTSSDRSSPRFRGRGGSAEPKLFRRHRSSVMETRARRNLAARPGVASLLNQRSKRALRRSIGMGPGGFEPPTSCLSCRRASQLRQGPERRAKEYPGRLGRSTGWARQPPARPACRAVAGSCRFGPSKGIGSGPSVGGSGPHPRRRTSARS